VRLKRPRRPGAVTAAASPPPRALRPARRARCSATHNCPRGTHTRTCRTDRHV